MKIDEIRNKILQGDVIEVLKQIPDNSVDCIVTSPPYWGLRDYGIEGQLGLEKTLGEYLDKMILVLKELKRVMKPTSILFWNHGDSYASFGSLETRFWHGDNPGKHRFGGDGNLSKGYSGRSRTQDVPSKSLVFQNYRLMIRACDELGFVIRDCLVWAKKLWIAKTNTTIGNAMPSSTNSRCANTYEPIFMLVKSNKPNYYYNEKTGLMQKKKPLGIKGKEGEDWEWEGEEIDITTLAEEEKRLWKEYQERNIHLKSNDIGFSNRFSNYSKIQHLVHKAKKKVSLWRSVDYFFDSDSLRVPHKENSIERIKYPILKYGGDLNNPLGAFGKGKKSGKNIEMTFLEKLNPFGATRPNVFQINTQPCELEHFAIFPEALVSELIRAGCPQWVCRYCGLPRTRIIEKEQIVIRRYKDKGKAKEVLNADKSKMCVIPRTRTGLDTRAISHTVGWSNCSCEDEDKWQPGIVLDPFFGSGTTGLVAKKLGRNYVGIEINKNYVKMSKQRIDSECGTLFD